MPAEQSPINLANAIRTAFRPAALSRHWKPNATGFPSPDISHGLKLLFDPDPQSYVSVSGKEFALLSFHFHHPAEHFLDGHQFPAELHIVHQNFDDATHAVIAVFIDGGAESPHSALGELCTCLARQDSGPFPYSTNPQDWLPGHLSHFYRYVGSLTTEPFSETVTWTVFAEPIRGTIDQLNDLIKRMKSDARGLQPINRRYVIEYGSKRKAGSAASS